MNARAEQATFPVSLRWLVVPTLGWVVAVSIVEVIRRRAREPRVAAMSDEWLRQHAADAPAD